MARLKGSPSGLPLGALLATVDVLLDLKDEDSSTSVLALKPTPA